MRNDVLALLEMMLTFVQMMFCPADTNKKIQADWLGFFGSEEDCIDELFSGIKADSISSNSFSTVSGVCLPVSLFILKL